MKILTDDYFVRQAQQAERMHAELAQAQQQTDARDPFLKDMNGRDIIVGGRPISLSMVAKL